MALVLHEEEVRHLLTMPDTIAVLEQAFRALAGGYGVNQPRSRIESSHGFLHILAADAPSLGVMGFKTYTTFREGVRFVIMLFSAQDGQLLSIIEADWLGRMRTGGTSGLATNYLALPDATVVGLIGAGKQAATQLMGVCAVRPISLVYVYSRNVQSCKIFCDEMSRLLHISVSPVAHPRQAVEYADIVITATTSQEPVLQGEWLKPGCHINAIGSNWAEKRELDPSTLQNSFLIVTDSKEQARMEAGDFILADKEELFDWNWVYDLSEVVGHQGPRRESTEDITIYKGLGIALEDIAAAAHVYMLAKRQGVGQNVPLLS
ncbi:MAG: ornithine cyclodeaminase family protein [Chloroflexota bacterium]|nr:ornithine cyclodeaminase family protein [Chloroflexota bacterium]